MAASAMTSHQYYCSSRVPSTRPLQVLQPLILPPCILASTVQSSSPAVAASANLVAMADLYGTMYQQMQNVTGGLDDKGLPLLKDVHDWLESTFPQGSPAHLKLVQDCQDLEQKCRDILNLPASGPYLAQVPAKQDLWHELPDGASSAKAFKLRAWQMDFRRAGQVKAGASLHAIQDCLHKDLVGVGNKTAKYPATALDLFDSAVGRIYFNCIAFLLSSSVAFFCVAPDPGQGGSSS